MQLQTTIHQIDGECYYIVVDFQQVFWALRIEKIVIIALLNKIHTNIKESKFVFYRRLIT